MNDRCRIRRLARIAALGSVCLISFISSGNRAYAIPAFARKYGQDCSTCHDAMPRLSQFGEAFRLHGYRLAGNEKDEELGPSGIPKALQLSFRNRNDWQGDLATGANQIHWEWELLGGGTFGPDVDFFGHANFKTTSQSGAQNASTSVSSIAGLNFRNVIPHPMLTLSVGLIGWSEADLPNFISHVVVTNAKYLKDDLRIPYPATGFDVKNTLRVTRRGPGMVLSGHTSSLKYALGYQKGTQEGDNSSSDNLYTQWAYQWGGTDYNYDSHADISKSVGVFGAAGAADVTPTGLPRTRDRFWRLGVDAQIQSESSWSLAAGVIGGTNRNPYGDMTKAHVDIHTWLVKGEYWLTPKLLPNVRFEEEDERVPGVLNLGDTRRARLVPNLLFYPHESVRLGIEGLIYTDRRHDKTGKKLDNDALAFYTDFAF